MHSCYNLQGSPNLQKIGRLDFSLREHEGEVKAWQGDMFPQKCGFFPFFCIWSVSLLISCLYLSYLILNSCFVFVLLLLLILYLLILDLFIFALKSVNDIKMFVSCPRFPTSPWSPCLKLRQADCLAFKKLQIT